MGEGERSFPFLVWCFLPCLGTQVPARTHIYISSESAPAYLKIPARDAKGERPKVKGRWQAGSLGGREQGLTCGLGLKVRRCFRSCYLPPHILKPTTLPHLPCATPGTPSQSTGRKGCGSQKGVMHLSPKFGSHGVREGLLRASSSSIPDQSLLPEGGVRAGKEGGSPPALPLVLSKLPSRYSLFLQKGKESMGGEPRGLGVIKRPKGPGGCPQLAPISLPGIASDTMSVTSGKTRPSLTQEILSHLGLANKVGAVMVGIIVDVSTAGR